MVLQRDRDIHVWGWADVGENVKVNFKGINRKTRAGANGAWHVVLPPSEYGGPFEMTISASNKIVLNNILVGDVWFCSGQSNMDMNVAGAKDSELELKNINYPNLRLYSVRKEMSESEQENIINSRWHKSDINSVSGFSAVAYFFGRELYNKLQIPIGLIQSSWSGTNIQTWMSGEAMSGFDEYLPQLEELKTKNYKELTSKRDMNYKQWKDTLHLLETGTVSKWYLPETDDWDWKDVSLPFVWNWIGYNGNGVGWFRKEFDLTRDEASSNILFMLGLIHTGDEVFLNGEKIGECYNFDQSRIYFGLPPLLREGKNILAIKVYNEWGDGGFYGKSQDIYMQIGNEKKHFTDSWKFKSGHISPNPSLAIHPSNYPTLLFNTMVKPITEYPVKGVVWYQGEDNSDNPKEYGKLLPALIRDWRKQWNNADLPFLIVQIPNFMHDGDSTLQFYNWAALREAQAGALSLPNTGMAVTIDIGEADNIHPKNKQDVAYRLSLQALNKVYHKNDIIDSGPIFNSVDFVDNKAIVQFENIGGGLVTTDKYGYVKGFAIAGMDRKFYWAKALIKDNRTVEVSSEKVNKPAAIRFLWSFSPDVTLYNTEGLPAAPFRTDNWE